MNNKDMKDQSTQFKEDTSQETANPEHGHNTEADTPDDNMAEESLPEGDNLSNVSDDGENGDTPSAEPDWKDKYMRLSAEFDNYRKRTLKEKMDLISSGGEDVLKAMLPVMDDMDRALTAMETSTDACAVREGVVLISQKLGETMRSKGVTEIESLGAELDTDLHEAVAKFPVEGNQKGKIIDVVQKGYKLRDKVIRYAKVVVGE